MLCKTEEQNGASLSSWVQEALTSEQLQHHGDSTRKQLTCQTAALLGSLSSSLLLKFPLSMNYLYKTKDLLGLINSSVEYIDVSVLFPREVAISEHTRSIRQRESIYRDEYSFKQKSKSATEYLH